VYPYKDSEIIGGKYEIKKSYQTIILVPPLHRDPAVWGDRAEVFDPENHTREAEASRSLHAFKPFGNGQRACIGRQFAMQEAALVLGMILQRFELIDHTRYQLKVKESLTVKPDEFKIRVKPRPGREMSGGLRTGDASPATATATNGAVSSARPVIPNRPGHNTPLLVLYGSNLGTAEGVARQIADQGDAKGFQATVAPLDDYTGRLPTNGAVVIASASYNGAPPDNAGKFCAWLETGAGSLKGVRYAVFGCGNRDWAATFQTVPRMIDEKLAAAGAHRITAHGEGDARDDFDGQFQAWFAPLLGTVAQDLGVDIGADGAERGPQYAVEVVSPREVSPFVGSLGASTMTIGVNRELHTKQGAHPSPRSTRHIEVALPKDVSYRAGDHLGVIPRNQLSLVRRVAERFALAPEARVVLRAADGRKGVLPVDQPIQVFRLLGDYVELQDVASRKQIQALAAHTRCPHTRPKLEALASDDARYRTEVFAKRKSVFDLLEEHKACELPFNVYLEMLPPLRPRYYSISSSPLVMPNACSISVAVVDEPHRSGHGAYQGVCSNYLRPQRKGEVIYAFVKDTKSAFRLPADPRTPVIMIGPGTGLAPFRGFLQERQALKAAGKPVGPAELFFGCRRPDQDFIYADELKSFASEGLCTLHVAFSRAEGQPKRYVQDLIKAEASRLWEHVKAGGVIYVCGDASRMAPAVRQAFIGIIAEKAGLDLAAAEKRVDAMASDGKYFTDVWATG
jgi:cytochrome P450/NADPH-cytochrome P450 reductase